MMGTRVLVVVAPFAAAFAGGFYLAARTPPAPPAPVLVAPTQRLTDYAPPAEEAAPPAADEPVPDWSIPAITVSGRRDDFRATFPAQPVIGTVPPSPVTMLGEQFIADTGGRRYIVTRMAFTQPPETADWFFSRFISGITQGSRVDGEPTKIVCGEYPGRELAFTTRQGRRMRARVYLADDRAFMLMVVVPRAELLKDPAVERFFATFEIK